MKKLLLLLISAISLNFYGQLAEDYYNKGFAKDEAGDYKGALTEYSKAIGLDSNFAKAYYVRGICKEKLGDTKGSVSDLTKAISLNHTSPKAYFIRGNYRYELGDVEGALQDFTKTVELDLVDYDLRSKAMLLCSGACGGIYRRELAERKEND